MQRELDHDRLQRHSGAWRDGLCGETGAAQHWRDARITTIYEGTTGIQANDLIGRKLARGKGVNAGALIRDMKAELEALAHEKLAKSKVRSRRIRTSPMLNSIGNGHESISFLSRHGLQRVIDGSFVRDRPEPFWSGHDRSDGVWHTGNRVPIRAQCQKLSMTQ